MKKLLVGLSLLSNISIAEIQINDQAIITCGNNKTVYHAVNVNYVDKLKSQMGFGTVIEGTPIRESHKFNVYCKEENIQDTPLQFVVSNTPLIEVESYQGIRAGDVVQFEDHYISKKFARNASTMEMPTRMEPAMVERVFSNGFAEVRDLKTAVLIFQEENPNLNMYNVHYLDLNKVTKYHIPAKKEEFLSKFEVGDKVKYVNENPRYHDHIRYFEAEVESIEFNYGSETATITIRNTLEKPRGIKYHNWPRRKKIYYNPHTSIRLEALNGNEELSDFEKTLIKTQNRAIKKQQNQPQQQQVRARPQQQQV